MDKAKLIKKATEQLKQYPQYMYAFDDCVVACIKKQITTKAGKAFETNELVLIKPVISKFIDLSKKQREMITAYSFNNKMFTSIDLKDVNVLESVKMEIVQK